MGTRHEFTIARSSAMPSLRLREESGSRRALNPTTCALRDRRVAAEDPRLDVVFSSIGEILVATLDGDIVGRTAGEFKEVLLDPITNGTSKLIVDLSAVRTLTRAGLGGLIVASKLVRLAGGSLRICGANRDAETLLSSLHLDHLIHLDASQEISLAILSGTRSRFDLTDIPHSFAETLCRPSREREDWS